MNNLHFVLKKQYDFKEDCLLYGASVVENTAKRKTFDVHAVRTMEFQNQNGFLRQVPKSTLADAIWNSGT